MSDVCFVVLLVFKKLWKLLFVTEVKFYFMDSSQIWGSSVMRWLALTRSTNWVIWVELDFLLVPVWVSSGYFGFLL